ncbi:MAG: patatin-like phospholipase family protein, partial [Candidatus Cloacimonetes bacterium]|nr:patatin-like phospholipase family protein [Candidatus Cloacimonadota bacterium]
MKRINLIVLVLIVALNAFGKEKIGLALSGGGARGLAHIGVLKVIDELEIPIDYIAGTSTGAIIGGLYAMGYSAAEIEDIVLGITWEDIFDEKICREDVYVGQKRWKPYANYFFALDENFLPKLPQAFLSGNNLINQLFTITYPVAHIKNFDELAIPFRCIATNILNGEMKIFSSGSIHEVMCASMSFPTMLKPFKLQDQLYVDGGILANLPTEVVKEMGADFVIGIKTNTGLKGKDELVSLIDVLDQTINLHITKNINESIQFCDILIEPQLEDISILDFNKKKEIINLGEEAAKKYFAENQFNFEMERKTPELNFLPEKVSFSRISVTGNKHLSKTKIKEYVGLHSNIFYSRNEIVNAIEEAFNSELFTIIYPVIKQSGTDYILNIIVEEKDRKQLGFSLSYNDNNEIVVGLTLDLNNIIQRNSKLLLNLQLGDKQEVNLDYVKNFGKQWGIYFRIFPYISEHRLYSYNEEHEKMKSVRSLEYGGTSGIGLFAQEAVIAEAFIYTFKSRLYRDIAEFEGSEFNSTGIGLKLYHESLDDYVFPMHGTQFIAKYSTAKKGIYSDAGNKKLYTKLRMLLPFGESLSVKYQFEYGSHFRKYEDDFDPFYIGGIDSYMGLYSRERSAPIYKINTLALRFRFIRNLFCDLQMNILNL